MLRSIGRIVDKKDIDFTTGKKIFQSWVMNAPSGAYIIWFSNTAHNHLYGYGVVTIRVSRGVEPVAVLADGAVFKINRNYVSHPNP